MQKLAIKNVKRKKFLVVCVALLLVVVGYLTYKYTYIYTERRKYDQAATAIQKVAADLGGQSIKTDFSKGCGRTQAVYGQGAITCDVGIKYKYPTSNDRDVFVLHAFIDSINKAGFITNETLNGTGNTSYSSSDVHIPCSLSYSKNDEGSQFDFGCGNAEKFNLF